MSLPAQNVKHELSTFFAFKTESIISQKSWH